MRSKLIKSISIIIGFLFLYQQIVWAYPDAAYSLRQLASQERRSDKVQKLSFHKIWRLPKSWMGATKSTYVKLIDNTSYGTIWSISLGIAGMGIALAFTAQSLLPVLLISIPIFLLGMRMAVSKVSVNKEKESETLRVWLASVVREAQITFKQHADTLKVLDDYYKMPVLEEFAKRQAVSEQEAIFWFIDLLCNVALTIKEMQENAFAHQEFIEEKKSGETPIAADIDLRDIDEIFGIDFFGSIEEGLEFLRAVDFDPVRIARIEQKIIDLQGHFSTREARVGLLHSIRTKAIDVGAWPRLDLFEPTLDDALSFI